MTKRGGGRREVSRKLRGLDQVGTGDFLKERAPSGMTITSARFGKHIASFGRKIISWSRATATVMSLYPYLPHIYVESNINVRFL